MRLICQDAEHICDKNQYKEAGFWEKVKLTIHLIYCRACQKYTSRNNKLTKLVTNPKVEVMPVTTKEKLNAAFQKELANQQ